MDFTEKCNNALCAIYASVGKDGTKWVGGCALANQLGYNIGELMTIADYLEREGYIKWHQATGGGAIAPTGKGIM